MYMPSARCLVPGKCTERQWFYGTIFNKTKNCAHSPEVKDYP